MACKATAACGLFVRARNCLCKYPRNRNSSVIPAVTDTKTHTIVSNPVRGARSLIALVAAGLAPNENRAAIWSASTTSQKRNATPTSRKKSETRVHLPPIRSFMRLPRGLNANHHTYKTRPHSNRIEKMYPLNRCGSTPEACWIRQTFATASAAHTRMNTVVCHSGATGSVPFGLATTECACATKVILRAVRFLF